MKPLLDLTDVNYTYQTAEGETPAVKNLSFRVFPDHFLGIIGPSGCGKSTILSLIAGLIQPNSGKIAVSAEIGIVHVHKFYRADVTRSVRKIDLGCRNEPRAVRVIVTRYVARNFNDFHLIAGAIKRFSAGVLTRDVYRIIRRCSV